VTIPLAPRTARAIDLAIGERTQGPVVTYGDREPPIWAHVSIQWVHLGRLRRLPFLFAEVSGTDDRQRYVCFARRPGLRA
jgi:hypothetical protein